MPDLATIDWAQDRIFDSALVSHGLTPYMRDYDLIVEVPASKPDGSGSYMEGRYRYRFTHCVEANLTTNLGADTWKASWGDEFTSYSDWQKAGEPPGFVWGVEWADMYPGVSRVASSSRSRRWSGELGRLMHEVEIETNVFCLHLVCHDLEVSRLAPR